MRTGTWLGLSMLLLAAWAAEARADVPPGPSPRRPDDGLIRWPWEKRPEKPLLPKPPPEPPHFRSEPFTVEILGDHEGVQPVLQVTPNFYRALRRIALEDVPTETKMAEAPAPETSPYRSAIAGAALALAFATGGLWLRRSGAIGKMRLAILLGLAAAASVGGTMVMAALPPLPKPPSEMKAQLPPLPIENQLRIELLDQKNDAVRIRVSRAYLEKLLEASKPAVRPMRKDDGPILPPPPPPLVFPTVPK